MKRGSILTECIAILAIAAALGTAVNVLRTDKEQRIPFFGKYTDVFTPKAAPSAPPAPAAATVASRQPPVAASQPPVTIHPPPAATTLGVKPADPPPAPPPPVKAEPAGPVREVQLDEILALHKEEDTPFFDARRTRNYDQGHIPLSQPMSVWEQEALDEKISNLVNELPLDVTIVIYCGGGDCNDSHMLADRLVAAGYKDLRIFKGGFTEWVKKGLPVEKDGQIVEGPVQVPDPGEEKK